MNRYLLYAIGEIALVVIGILIALQINLWNEDRKGRRLEHSTLQELHTTLVSEVQFFENLIETQLKLARSSGDLLDHLNQQRQYTPKLDTMWERGIRYYTVEFNNAAYELLQSRGIDLIRNADLRNMIVQHYNNDQSKLKRRLEIAHKNSDEFMAYAFDRLYPPIDRDFVSSFDHKNEALIPSDYDALLNDPVMKARLSHSIKVRVRMSQMLGEFVERQKSLGEAIQTEIEKFER